MFTIKGAAEQVGVSVATLRAWELRYGIGATQRTESGYRLYDAETVRALTAMNALVRVGWSVRAAAEEAVRGSSVVPAQRPDAASGGRSGDVRSGDVQALVHVAERFDGAGLTALLEERFAAAPFESVADGWLLPALRSLGEAWETGRVSVAGEHLVAQGVARRLAAAYDAAGDNPAAPKVVIGLPPGARHDLGLLAFATAVRRAGLSPTYLGADVPADDWAAAVADRSADGVVMALPMASDAPAAAEAVVAITSRRPELLVAVGGAAQELAPDRCLRLGHEVAAAAAVLRRRLARV